MEQLNEIIAQIDDFVVGTGYAGPVGRNRNISYYFEQDF